MASPNTVANSLKLRFCCDNHASSFVELAEWEVSRFVEDHQIGFDQRFSDFSGLALCLFLFERIDQFNR